MACNRIKTRDKGQRYEVRYIPIGTNEEKVFGWCSTKVTADKMRSQVMMWPHASKDSTRVVDRGEK